MNVNYNLNQKLKRMERNEIRSNIKITNELLLQLKTEAFKRGLKTNTYLIHLLTIALETVFLDGKEVNNLKSLEAYDELKTLQVILPLELSVNIKMFGLQLEARRYYTNEIKGLKAIRRSTIDLIYTGILIDNDMA